MYEDNQGAIALTSNPVFHSKTKHIRVKYHGIRDMIKDGEIRVEYLRSEQMLADGFTKALPPVLFARFRERLALVLGEHD